MIFSSHGVNSEVLNIIFFMLLFKKFLVVFVVIIIVGPKGLATPAYLILSPRSTSRKEKRLRTNKEGPNCWETSPRMTLSSASQGHERRKRGTPKDSPSRCPKQNDQHSGPAMRAWWRSDSRRDCHLHIKYPQLIVWSH